MKLTEDQFYAIIKLNISENPKLLRIAIQAVNEGSQEALYKAHKANGDLQAAFLCALGLLEPKRLKNDMIDYLNSVIVDKIKNTEHKTPLEERFLEKSEVDK